MVVHTCNLGRPRQTAWELEDSLGYVDYVFRLSKANKTKHVYCIGRGRSILHRLSQWKYSVQSQKTGEY